MDEAFAGDGEVLVDRCEMIFQRLARILTLTRPSTTLSRPTGESSLVFCASRCARITELLQ